jgi:seryl-tRNA synthetase
MSVTSDKQELLAALIEAGLLIDQGVPGLYGHGADFERVRSGLEVAVSAIAHAAGAETMSFPPLVPREMIESIGYLNTFPHLAGSVFSFYGDEAEAAEQAAQAAAHADWSAHQGMTEVMLTPAACYPLYPAVAKRGPLPAGGVLVDIGAGWVFRHEPSVDPARRVIFRMHEIVRIAGEADILEWRKEWMGKGLEFLLSLGLDVELDDANDPFFGRGGRMLAANQRAQQLKLEFLCPITDGGKTAIASSNYHQDHFGEHYDMRLPDGELAHTSCLAFGHDRVVLALLHTHGFELAAWPEPVRQILGL